LVELLSLLFGSLNLLFHHPQVILIQCLFLSDKLNCFLQTINFANCLIMLIVVDVDIFKEVLSANPVLFCITLLAILLHTRDRLLGCFDLLDNT
jgi:hypothetical protein